MDNTWVSRLAADLVRGPLTQEAAAGIRRELIEIRDKTKAAFLATLDDLKGTQLHATVRAVERGEITWEEVTRHLFGQRLSETSAADAQLMDLVMTSVDHNEARRQAGLTAESEQWV